MAENYGLLNNIAGGIREGMNTYMTLKNQQRQEALLENQLKSQEQDRQNRLAQEGQMMRLRELNLESDAMNRGLLLKRGEQGEITGFDRDPNYKKPGSALEELTKTLAIQNTQGVIAERNRKAKEDEEKKSSPNYQFGLLPKESQIQIEDLSKKVSGRTGIATSLQSGLDKINDPKISDDQKLITARQMIKTLNSTEGQDAVGTEEAKRLAGLLEFRFFNLTEPGPIYGRAPIGEFGSQVKNKIDEIKSTRGALENEIVDIYKRSGREDLAKASGLMREPVDQTKNLDPDAEKYAQMHGLSYDVAKGIIDGRKSKAAKFTQAR